MKIHHTDMINILHPYQTVCLQILMTKMITNQNNLNVLSSIFPDMSTSKPKLVDMKAQNKLDYVTNNNDRTKIKTDKVSSSSVFNKERTLSQNKNSNSNNTKVSLYITFQRNNTTTKPMIVKDKKKKYKGHLMIKNVLTQ